MYKAYDSLDRGWCLDNIRGYRLGPNLARLITHYWEHQRIVTRAGKFLGKAFGTGRGVTQGDPTSPMIINIVVDAVMRAVLDEVCRTQEAHNGLGWAVEERNLAFYANNGMIAGQEQEWVQDTLTGTV